MPISSIVELDHIKGLLRLFTLVTIASIIILIIVTRGDATRVVSYSTQFIDFMSMYRYPISLGVNYMKEFLEVGNKGIT